MAHIHFGQYVRTAWRNYVPPHRVHGPQTIKVVDSSLTITSWTGDEERCQLSSTYWGFPCSPGGEIVGYVRVITDLTNEARLVQRGEILVAPNASPAMTPLFSLVRGVILEEGCVLSHGVLVARYCVRSVLAKIKNATKILKSGDKIMIHGDKGVLKVLELV